MTHQSCEQKPHLDQLPFLQSLCWQGLAEERAQFIDRPPAEILAIYERGWRWRGVIADMSEVERQYIKTLATQFSSWLLNEL